LAESEPPTAAQAGAEEPEAVYGLDAARTRCLRQLAHLPPELRSLADADETYPVTVDPELEALLEEQRDRISER
jgi:hypothetical protein